MKFFSFSKLRKFLKQDMEALRLKRYRNGYRQTIQCDKCKKYVKSRGFGFTDVCDCGNISIEENAYYYKITGEYDEKNVRSVLYNNFREVKC